MTGGLFFDEMLIATKSQSPEGLLSKIYQKAKLFSLRLCALAADGF